MQFINSIMFPTPNRKQIRWKKKKKNPRRIKRQVGGDHELVNVIPCWRLQI